MSVFPIGLSTQCKTKLADPRLKHTTIVIEQIKQLCLSLLKAELDTASDWQIC